MLKKYLKKHPVLILTSLMLTIIQVFTLLFQPQITQWVLQEILKTNIDMTQVNKYGVMLLVVGALGLIVGVVNTIVSAKVAQEIGAEIREDGFRKIQELSFEDVEKFTTANLVVRLTNDVTQIQNLLMMGLQLILRVPIIFVGAFILAVLEMPHMWWTIIVYVLIVFGITTIIMRKNQPRFGKIQGSKDKLNTIIKENLDGVRVVKSFVTEKKEEKKHYDANKEMQDLYWKVGRDFSIMIPSFMFVANIVIMYAIWVIGMNSTSTDDISHIASFMQYAMQLMFAILMAGFLGMTVGMGSVSIKRVAEVLDEEPSIKFGNKKLDKIGDIEFKNVSFKYNGEEDYTLEDISFKIKQGEKVGIVGSTGSGKTTLVQLIPRLYDITDGELLINNENIADFTADSLRSKISIILQKAFLFSGKIKDVVKQGKKDATQDEMELAAERAQALEFINKKDATFDGEVYQRGNNFSGGQKQRLSIARGLVRNPDLLILDDSTSALDAKSENLVKQVIEKDLQETTIIIVSQKISSVVNSDKIIVLEDGKIDAIGTHKELVKSSPVYQEIYETQKGKEV